MFTSELVIDLMDLMAGEQLLENTPIMELNNGLPGDLEIDMNNEAGEESSV